MLPAKKRARRDAQEKTRSDEQEKVEEGNCAATVQASTCHFHTFTDQEIEGFRTTLLEWYDSSHRQLPWRSIARSKGDATAKGYAVWVSEVMLQQTQVVTVIDYYRRWMEKWPTVKDLSEASLDEVFQVWAGLGYYQRARRLHEGAGKVQREMGGVLPGTTDELMAKIPGVGRYTAAAIASIAYGEAVGAVDGNVVRVLSRMRLVGCAVGTAVSNQLLWKLADVAVSRTRPGDFNQALMELGATVCTPKNPSCPKCPLRGFCLANQMANNRGKLLPQSTDRSRGHRPAGGFTEPDIEDTVPRQGCTLCLPLELWNPNENTALLYPHKPPRKEPREEVSVVLVLRRQQRYFVQRRTGKGRLLEGLFEFPNVVADRDAASEKKLQHLAVSLYEGIVSRSAKGLSVPKPVGEVAHAFSHIKAAYRIYVVDVSADIELEDDAGGRWMTATEIRSSGISTAMKKVLSKAAGGGSRVKGRKASSPPDAKQQKLCFTNLRRKRES